MNQRERFKKLILFIANAAVTVAATAVFGYIWFTRYSNHLSIQYGFWGHYAIIGIYAFILILLTKIFGGFKIGYLKTTDVILSQILAILISNIVAYMQVTLIVHKYTDVLTIVKMTCLDFGIMIPWTIIVRYILTKLYPPRQMIVVYGDYSPKDLIAKINKREDKYNICASINISAGIDRVQNEILNYEAVVICDVPSQIRNVLLKYCFKKSIRTYVTPKISDIMIRGGDAIHLFDTPLILSRNHGLSIEQTILKRLMDIVFSLMALIILSPFMIISALIIKLYDRGPVFYRQDRLTIDGKVFRILKFRSMCVESEVQGAQLAKKDDDRITPIGKFLRAIHFDEIPQILNILKGDMSFVGPRPERPEIAEEYESSIPEFGFRLKVKAGLTGYAQVYGKYNTTPYDKLKLDMSYIMNYSFWLDIKLIIMTFKIIFQKENSEGVSTNQKTAAKDNRIKR